VTGRAEIFLGILAAATLTMALVQVGVIIAAGLAVRRAAKFMDRVEARIEPLFHHADAIGRDVSRAAALATAQVERADKLFSDVAVRVEEALDTVQASLGAPAREGRALWSAFRAAFQAIRDLRQDGRGRQGRADDEDALFI
jgi:hypothetical protein